MMEEKKVRTNMREQAAGSTDERIIPKIRFPTARAQELLEQFGLTLDGDLRELGGGRIANNYLAKTRERGEVILRVYPRAYGTAKTAFEVEVLSHLSQSGLPVPAPLPLRDSSLRHTHVLAGDQISAFVYPALPGATLTQEMLSVDIASICGQTLSRMVPEAMKYTPRDFAPEGDLGFIGGLLRAAKERDPSFSHYAVAGEMEEVVGSGLLRSAMSRVTRGIVHADFFFENVLMSGAAVSGVLDFGDAYYGGVVNDAVIGAMEFCVTEDERWHLDMWRAYLEPNSDWLSREPITARQIRELLLANCVRFAVYTIPFTQQEGRPVEENKYVQRFTVIRHTDLGDRLESIWKEVVGE